MATTRCWSELGRFPTPWENWRLREAGFLEVGQSVFCTAVGTAESILYLIGRSSVLDDRYGGVTAVAIMANLGIYRFQLMGSKVHGANGIFIKLAVPNDIQRTRCGIVIKVEYSQISSRPFYQINKT
ncbi:unnamed protein product [Nezara viridula]|uniref:Uncharacterized protein n=1 Tax=Nezara viridula TaxID=85310 RepID=A0A9P0E4H5_NEZVI|nr:unnamed protein product [Nezara viridula]